MREKLYWTIEKFSLRYDYFMFFDTTPYLADQLFIRHQVRAWFDEEYARDGFHTWRFSAMYEKRMFRSFWKLWRT